MSKHISTKNSIFISRLPADVSKASLRNTFSPFGEIERLKLKYIRNNTICAGYGFLECSTPEMMAEVVKASPFIVDGAEIRCEVNERGTTLKHYKEDLNRRKVYVIGIPQSAKDEDLRAVFEPIAKIERAYTVKEGRSKESKHYGFVICQDVEGAEKLLSARRFKMKKYKLTCKRFEKKTRKKRQQGQEKKANNANTKVQQPVAPLKVESSFNEVNKSQKIDSNFLAKVVDQEATDALEWPVLPGSGSTNTNGVQHTSLSTDEQENELLDARKRQALLEGRQLAAGARSDEATVCCNGHKKKLLQEADSDSRNLESGSFDNSQVQAQLNNQRQPANSARASPSQDGSPGSQRQASDGQVNNILGRVLLDKEFIVKKALRTKAILEDSNFSVVKSRHNSFRNIRLNWTGSRNSSVQINQSNQFNLNALNSGFTQDLYAAWCQFVAQTYPSDFYPGFNPAQPKQQGFAFPQQHAPQQQQFTPNNFSNKKRVSAGSTLPKFNEYSYF